jgi:hypothetical protein
MSDINNKYLVNSLVGDYQKLTQDIMMYENELDARDKKWQSIGSLKNPDFETDRKKEFINNKISDLTLQRNKIWNFLTLQFNNNTIIRDKNYKELQTLNTELSKTQDTIHEKKEELEASDGLIGKQRREYEIIKYKNAKDQELVYLHFLGLLCLIICIGLMIYCGLGYMTVHGMFISCCFILIIFLLYLVKVIFVDSVNQSYRYIHKKDFNKPSGTEIQITDRREENNDGCVRKTGMPEAEQDELMDKIKKTADLNEDTCLKNGTTE